MIWFLFFCVYDEPLRTKIVSAKASTIFEFHLHCTISELNTIFLIPVANTTYILTPLFYNPTSSYFQIPRF